MDAQSKILGFDSSKVLAAVVSLFLCLVGFDGERALTKIDALTEAQSRLDGAIGTLNAEYIVLKGASDDHETRIRIVEHELGTPQKNDFTAPISYKCYEFWTTDVQGCSRTASSSPTR